MRRTACLLLAPLALAVSVAACGSDGEDEDEAVRATVQRFAAATRAKDYQELCDQIFASTLVSQLRDAGLPCEVALRTGLGSVKRPTLVLRRVEVNDDAALARIRTGAQGQPPSDDALKLVKEDGSWKIASLSAQQPQPPEPKAP